MSTSPAPKQAPLRVFGAQRRRGADEIRNWRVVARLRGRRTYHGSGYAASQQEMRQACLQYAAESIGPQETRAVCEDAFGDLLGRFGYS
jgi:hypothetical protein